MKSLKGKLARLLVSFFAFVLVFAGARAGAAGIEGSYQRPDNYIQVTANDRGMLAGVDVDFALGQKNPGTGEIDSFNDGDGKPIIIRRLRTDERGYIDLDDLITNGTGEEVIPSIYIDNPDLADSVGFRSLDQLEAGLKGLGAVSDDFSINASTVLLFKVSDEDIEKYGARADGGRGFIEAFELQAEGSYKVKDRLSALTILDTAEVIVSFKAEREDGKGNLVPIEGAEFVLDKKDSDISHRARTNADGVGTFILYSSDFTLSDEGDKKRISSPFSIKQVSSASGYDAYEGEILLAGLFDGDRQLIENDGNLAMSYSPNAGSLLMMDKLARIDVRVKNSPAEKEKVPTTVERIKGSDRYETSLAVARESFTNADTVIVASGANTADALAAGPLAIKAKAPILLVGSDLSDGLLAEIRRLDPDEIIIVGGAGSVSPAIADGLGVEAENLIRLAGSTRYGTSVEIAKYIDGKYGIEGVILAEAGQSVDALTVAAYAGDNDLAILLTASEDLPNELSAYINASIDHVEIVGGARAVSAKIQSELGSKFAGRIGGANRFDTAVMLANETYDKPDTVVVVNAFAGIVDALAAAPFAYENDAPILLTGAKSLDVMTRKYIEDNKSIQRVVVVGGEASVADSVFQEISGVLPEMVEKKDEIDLGIVDEEDGRTVLADPIGEVVVYTKPTCPYCVAFLKFLDKYEIEYTEKDITASEVYREEFDDYGFRYVPALIVGDTQIPRFDAEKIREALGIQVIESR